MNATLSIGSQPRYELRFESLFHSGRARSFPCDANGEVLLDGLSESARCSYADTEAAVGREYATPAVQVADLH